MRLAFCSFVERSESEQNSYGFDCTLAGSSSETPFRVLSKLWNSDDRIVQFRQVITYNHQYNNIQPIYSNRLMLRSNIQQMIVNESYIVTENHTIMYTQFWYNEATPSGIKIRSIWMWFEWTVVCINCKIVYYDEELQVIIKLT